jgi:hypothetical protein
MPLSWAVNKFTALNSTTVKANGDVVDWDAYATTTVGYSTNFTATMTIVQTDLQCMFGLTPNTNPSFPVYTYMDMCLYMTNGGILYQFDNGTLGTNFGSYSIGDVLTIEYNGSTITYKKNGSTILTNTRTPGADLYLCCTAGIANAQFNNLTFSSGGDILIPSTPIIAIRPYILPFHNYTYFFGNNPDGPTTSSFSLTVNDTTSTVRASVGKIIFGDMTIGSYYSSFVVATSESGNSILTNYRTVQYGLKPDPPTNNSGSVVGNTIRLNYIPSLNDNGASIYWYVATNLLNLERYNTEHYNSTIIVSPLSVGSYNFKVQAVSDAGYSNPLYFSTLTVV